jgi:hypothetical protein
MRAPSNVIYSRDSRSGGVRTLKIMFQTSRGRAGDIRATDEMGISLSEDKMRSSRDEKARISKREEE